MPIRSFSTAALLLWLAFAALWVGSSLAFPTPLLWQYKSAGTCIIIITTTTTALASSSSDADAFFETETWQSTKKRLNKLPTFFCAVDNGAPLQFRQMENGEIYTTPFFYCDIQAAQDELALLGKSYKDMNIGVFPLGDAFELECKDQALIIPSQAAVEKTGAAPSGSSSLPIGKSVPLFGSVTQQNQHGEAVLPLFMVYEEAEAKSPSVISITLENVIQALTTMETPPAFEFVPPQTSVEYIKESNL
eukprot:scaffold1033_cov171-Amphora_coffeaeformis.AAC.37